MNERTKKSAINVNGKPIKAPIPMMWNSKLSGFNQLTNIPMNERINTGVLMNPKNQNNTGCSNIIHVIKMNVTKSAIGFTANCNKIGAKNQTKIADERIPKIKNGINSNNPSKINGKNIGNKIGANANIAKPMIGKNNNDKIIAGMTIAKNDNTNNAIAPNTKRIGESKNNNGIPNNDKSAITLNNNCVNKLASNPCNNDWITLLITPKIVNGNANNANNPNGIVNKFKPGIKAVNKPPRINGNRTNSWMNKNTGNPLKNNVINPLSKPPSNAGNKLNKKLITPAIKPSMRSAGINNNNPISAPINKSGKCSRRTVPINAIKPGIHENKPNNNILKNGRITNNNPSRIW